jgi:Amt family ammonium transporter
VFAATAATIVSGAMAERTKFKSYLVYSAFITGFIYPVVGRWMWGGGWLADLGFVDFAGSTIVHMTGGVAALVGAAVIGPRIGKYGADGKPRAILGHSIPFAVLGTLILWLGWFGFNPGSTLAAVPEIGDIALTTVLAGAAGAVMTMFLTWGTSKKPDVAMTCNGALAGLVGITAGTASVEPWAALVIGALSGAIVVGAVAFFDRIKIDDPVGAISVHGVCGAVGTLAVGVFGSPNTFLPVDGLLATGSVAQLGYQAVGVAAVGGFVAITATILFVGLKMTIGLRVDPEEEVEGLDVHEHGAPGYGHDNAVAPGATTQRPAASIPAPSAVTV